MTDEKFKQIWNGLIRPEAEIIASKLTGVRLAVDIDRYFNELVAVYSHEKAKSKASMKLSSAQKRIDRHKIAAVM